MPDFSRNSETVVTSANFSQIEVETEVETLPRAAKHFAFPHVIHIIKTHI